MVKESWLDSRRNWNWCEKRRKRVLNSGRQVGQRVFSYTWEPSEVYVFLWKLWNEGLEFRSRHNQVVSYFQWLFSWSKRHESLQFLSFWRFVDLNKWKAVKNRKNGNSVLRNLKSMCGWKFIETRCFKQQRTTDMLQYTLIFSRKSN